MSRGSLERPLLAITDARGMAVMADKDSSVASLPPGPSAAVGAAARPSVQLSFAADLQRGSGLHRGSGLQRGSGRVLKRSSAMERKPSVVQQTSLADRVRPAPAHAAQRCIRTLCYA